MYQMEAIHTYTKNTDIQYYVECIKWRQYIDTLIIQIFNIMSNVYQMEAIHKYTKQTDVQIYVKLYQIRPIHRYNKQNHIQMFNLCRCIKWRQYIDTINKTYICSNLCQNVSNGGIDT